MRRTTNDIFNSGFGTVCHSLDNWSNYMKISEYMNTSEAAEFLGIEKQALIEWDKSGKLKARRNPMNNYRMYKKEDLEKFLNSIKYN
jgi:hypothetical protein